MVAKITTPKKLIAVLLYNENKVAKAKAACIHAEGFLYETSEMTFEQKKAGFERLTQRNERAKTKTLHVSLNFDPSEKLSNEKLLAIAATYLKGIGFDSQPYLVYRHYDAAHPHIHIVTTTIREDGSRINTHNLGRFASEKARKEIELDFGLIQASKKKSLAAVVSPNQAAKYGVNPSHQTTDQIVTAIIQSYLFSSLPELNAILRTHGIEATTDKGSNKDHTHQGLYYQILDSNGSPTGVPLNASSLPGKPTLSKLEKLFVKNKPLKDPFKPGIRAFIDTVVSQQPKDLAALSEILLTKNIDVVLRQSTSGYIYGITFLDHNNKVVINGSHLGKKYSAAHLCKILKVQQKPENTSPTIQPSSTTQQTHSENIIAPLLAPDYDYHLTPNPLLKKKRKKKQQYPRHYN